MQLTFALVSSAVLLMASQAVGASVGAPVSTPTIVDRAANTATDPYHACNCPKNCSHKAGSSCKYYTNEHGNVYKGSCAYGSDGALYCTGP
ncbi:hypothetical protein NUW58_g9522 [Xylaria curta]|uniref:Uncharacterized protein n=1 Tax=Xylaria curta TaxID=42375 RepID=A0ACC1MX17_9PEZI|nr:hypothetical protein NUW58_g9522 [Xylaria curta]